MCGGNCNELICFRKQPKSVDEMKKESRKNSKKSRKCTVL